MLLVEGRTLYFGEREGAVPYFMRLNIPCPEYTNVADFLVGLCFAVPNRGEQPSATVCLGWL